MACRGNYWLNKFHEKTTKIVPTSFVSSGAVFKKNPCEKEPIVVDINLSTVYDYLSTIVDELSSIGGGGCGSAAQNVNQNVVVNVDMKKNECYLSSILGELKYLSSIDSKLDGLSSIGGCCPKQDINQDVKVNVDLSEIINYLSSLVNS